MVWDSGRYRVVGTDRVWVGVLDCERASGPAWSGCPLRRMSCHRNSGALGTGGGSRVGQVTYLPVCVPSYVDSGYLQLRRESWGT